MTVCSYMPRRLGGRVPKDGFQRLQMSLRYERNCFYNSRDRIIIKIQSEYKITAITTTKIHVKAPNKRIYTITSKG